MKIYISGKISDLQPTEVNSKFHSAVQFIASLKHVPVNPLDVDLPPNATWAEAMLLDLEVLSRCDGIYMLTDWRDSPGARIEHDFAHRMGLKIMYQSIWD